MIVNFVLVQFVPGGPIEQIIAEMEGRGDVFENIAGGGGEEAGRRAEVTGFVYVGARGLPPAFIADHYEVHEWRHASAILAHDFPDEWQDIIDVLTAFRLRREWIEVGGGNKSRVSAFIDGVIAFLCQA